MYSYTIIPLETDHLTEICDDIENQYKTGVASCALFCMPSTPEGNPPIDKARIYGEKYILFRDELRRRGYDCGILVQSTMGHGGKLNQKFGFQPYINLTDGEEKTYVACPYDSGFADHFRSVFAYYASLEPMAIMVDDDFRLLNRMGKGCACKKHLAEFNRRANTSFTREELYNALCSSKGEEYRRIFVKTQEDALLFSARAMREGIDSVNPKIQGIYCCCGNDAAGELAATLAGKGNPSIVRINNGCYTAAGARYLSDCFARAALQMNVDANKADFYLAETDTCPQNRYSTAAAHLHSHYTGTILEGASGAKHWITRMQEFEPASGKAYRQKLGRYSGFYEKLSDIAKTVTWQGCLIPMPHKFNYHPKGGMYGVNTNFSRDVIERLGFSMYFANFNSQKNSAVFLNGTPNCFTDSELKGMLSGPVFMASDTAAALIDRGMGEYLGVEVKEWQGEHTSGEIIVNTGKCMNAQNSIKQLVAGKNTEIYSYTYHLKDGKEKINLFPAVTYYQNALGGKVVVFCGTPAASFNYIEAFSFLNESRKAQLTELLGRVGALPVYYDGDCEVYLRSGVLPSGERLVAFFNIGLDLIDNITLKSNEKINSAEILTQKGERKEIGFTFDGEKYIFDISAPTLSPVILFIK